MGITLELLGLALMLVFVGYICTRVRSGGWLATAALAGGVIEVAVKLASGAPMFVAYLLRDELSPQTARVLTDMNSAAFVITWLPMGIFVAGAAAAGMRSASLGGSSAGVAFWWGPPQCW